MGGLSTVLAQHPGEATVEALTRTVARELVAQNFTPSGADMMKHGIAQFLAITPGPGETELGVVDRYLAAKS